VAKTDYDLDVLIHEAKKAVDCYEKYLLDVSDWRDLAKIMKTLMETIEAIEKKRKHGK
jgi:NADH:ubiquinone oxidoreductase subunit D